MDKSSFDFYSEDLDKVQIGKLTRKELATLHKHALNGNQEAWDDLWLYGTKLVLKICFTLKRQGLLQISFEDAVAEGNLAIGDALTRWNPKKSAFGTWIWIRVRGAILNGNQKVMAQSSNEVSENMPSTHKDANDAEYSGQGSFGSVWEPEEDLQTAVLYDAISQLPGREFSFIHQYYFEDVGLVELAKAEGVSRQMVRKVLDRAEDRLKIILSGGVA